MLNNKVFIAAAVLALLALGSCGTANVGANAPSLPDHASSAFQVSVMPESFDLGGSAANVYATVDTAMQQEKDHVVVNINVDNAQDLKSLYLDLKYDASQYRAMVIQPTELMGDQSDILSVYMPTGRGTVEYGQVLSNPDYRVGYTGSGVVAQVSFTKQPELIVRAVSNAGPPNTAKSQITDLAFDGVDKLTWTYFQQGDYDQNGETNAADLTPIAQHLHQTSPGGANVPWPLTDAKSQIDGDSNGEINAADITPIAQDFKHDTLGGFKAFKSASAADYPSGAVPTGANGAGATAVSPTAVQVTDAVNYANRGTERITFSLTDPTPGANDFYWVRASDGSGALGIASNIVGGNPATSPALSLDPTTPAASGAGTQGSPYEFVDTNNYKFILLDTPGGVDVSTDPNTVFIVNPAAAGTWTGNSLDVATGYSGNYVITATYNGVANHPSSNVYSHSGPVAGNPPVIDKDPADNDWTGVTGTGADDANSYLLHTPAFNPDNDANGSYDLTFGLAATEGGNPVANSSLTWDAFPPFVPFDHAAFTAAATAGTFQAWSFSVGYLFAQDPAQPGAAGKSNSLYVAVQSLPN